MTKFRIAKETSFLGRITYSIEYYGQYQSPGIIDFGLPDDWHQAECERYNNMKSCIKAMDEYIIENLTNSIESSEYIDYDYSHLKQNREK